MSVFLVYKQDCQVAPAIELHPTIRPEARRLIAELRQRNLSLYIISGDHETPTRKLAAELGIDHYFAETLPENTALRVPLGESLSDSRTARRRQIGLFSPKGTRSAVSAMASTTQLHSRKPM